MQSQERYASFSLSDFQEETRRYRIPNVPEDRTKCIDLLLDHLKRNGPLREAQQGTSQETVREPDRPGSSASGSTNYMAPDQDFTIPAGNRSAADTFLPHLCSPVSEQIKMQREQMLQQQQMMQQVFSSLCINPSLSQNKTQPREETLPPFVQEQRFTNSSRVTEIVSASIGHSVKFLMS